MLSTISKSLVELIFRGNFVPTINFDFGFHENQGNVILRAKRKVKSRFWKHLFFGALLQNPLHQFNVSRQNRLSVKLICEANPF